MHGAIHPLLVHFPVALLLTGTLTLFWGLFHPGRSPGVEIFSNGALGLGYAGLIVAIITGLYDLQASPKNGTKEGWVPLTVAHLACGILLLMVYGALMYRHFFLSGPQVTPQTGLETFEKPGGRVVSSLKKENPSTFLPRESRIVLVLALVGLVLLVTGAWLGGLLVYEYRVGIS